MSRAWQAEERLGEARPGGLLTAAATVPLGAALVLAAGLLPTGARAVLGVALVVLGVRVAALAGTSIGARIRPWTARAVGAALVAGGAVVLAGAVAVALDGGRPETIAGDGGIPTVPELGAGPAVALGLLVALAGVALLRGSGAATPGGTQARVPGGAPTGVASRATTGAVLAGSGAAVAVLALLGAGVAGLEAGPRIVAAAVVAGVAALVAARGSGPARGGAEATGESAGVLGAADGGTRGAVVRVAGIGAGVLLALVAGEATGLVRTVVGEGVGPGARGSLSEASGAFAIALVLAVAAGLALLAVRRRDVVLGVLPLGVLLQVRPVGSGIEQAGLLLVPVALTALALAAVLGVGPPARWVPRSAARGGLAWALVVLLVGVAGAFPDLGDPRATAGAGTGGLGVALAATLGLGAVAALALSSGRDTAGPGRGDAAAVALLVGLHLLHPLALVREAVPEAFGGDGPIVVAAVLELTIAAVVVARRPAPPVLAAGGLLVASTLSAVAVAFASGSGAVDAPLLVPLTLGTSGLAFVVVGAAALAGPAHLAGRAQAAAAGLGYGTVLFGLTVATLLTAAAAGGTTADGAALTGGEAVLAVLLLALVALGAALLAGSTARRPSAAAAAASGFAAVATGLAAAAVGASVVAGDREGPTGFGVRLVDAGLGFDDVGSRLSAAGGGWPLLLGVLGAVLLGAAAWLESRRPLPPDAPVG